MKNKFNDLISSMAAAGASAEDIAKNFTDALNAYTDRVKKEELKKAKYEDAAALMAMVGAFLSKYYGDDHWTPEVCDEMAKELVGMLDATDDMFKTFSDIAKVTPIKKTGSGFVGNVKTATTPCDHSGCGCKNDKASTNNKVSSNEAVIESALEFFDEFIKSL
jgi:hypothetical protein